MRIETNRLFLFLSIVFFFTSCDSNRIFEENKEIAGSSWDKNNIISFPVQITDTLLPHNVYINIRHNGQYLNSNIYLFINITSPSGDMIRDTVNCLLADEKGKWLGSGLGDLYHNQLMYKKNIRFPHSGTYKFDIEQAMRTDVLKDIEDVGIRIERSE